MTTPNPPRRTMSLSGSLAERLPQHVVDRLASYADQAKPEPKPQPKLKKHQAQPAVGKPKPAALPTESPAVANQPAPPPRPPEVQTARTERRRQINELTAALMQRYPKTFDRRRPLALARGSHKAVQAEFPEVPLPVLSRFFREWTSQIAYQMALKAGGPRHSLDGTPSGEITEDEQASAVVLLDILYKRRKERAAKAQATSP
jgi:sRNA-binding protein